MHRLKLHSVKNCMRHVPTPVQYHSTELPMCVWFNTLAAGATNMLKPNTQGGVGTSLMQFLTLLHLQSVHV